MSAYLMDPSDIGKIAQVGVKACEYGKTFTNTLTNKADNIAEVLALENIKSVRARYNEGSNYKLTDNCEFFDYSYAKYIELCRASAGITYNTIINAKVMDLVLTYDYQACESDDYYDSLARVILDQIAWKIAGDFARVKKHEAEELLR